MPHHSCMLSKSCYIRHTHYFTLLTSHCMSGPPQLGLSTTLLKRPPKEGHNAHNYIFWQAYMHYYYRMRLLQLCNIRRQHICPASARVHGVKSQRHFIKHNNTPQVHLNQKFISNASPAHIAGEPAELIHLVSLNGEMEALFLALAAVSSAYAGNDVFVVCHHAFLTLHNTAAQTNLCPSACRNEKYTVESRTMKC